MTFRSRLLVAFGGVVLVPLAVFGLGIRREMARRVGAQYERRVTSLVAVIGADVARESDGIAGRLGALKDALAADNRFRVSALQGGERSYLLDYAGSAMRLAGLDFLQILDDEGRVVSSGHFRNEYDRLSAAPPSAGPALVGARTAEGTFLALIRADSLRLGAGTESRGRRFTLVGGVAVDSLFLSRLARDGELAVSVVLPGDSVAPDSAGRVVAELPYVDSTGASVRQARIVVTHSADLLTALQRNVDTWFAAAVLATALIALLLAGWLSTRISRPLTALAGKTAAIDVDRLDVVFESDRADEIGALTRLLGAMTERLRTGAARLRDMERRVALGDLARQVNHDVKNGLAPLRNVFRHLTQVARDEPAQLPQVFAERQGTVESSIGYLETLAANYARLYPQMERKPTDVNAVVREALRHVAGAEHAELRTELPDGLPPVRVDALVLRRVLENLVGNAVDSLEGRPGTVTVATERGDGVVRITVADTGRGMTRPELDRAFDDFYTTKAGGTGLGLSIVRRLVLDSQGALRVETEPDQGSTFIVELPGEGGGGHVAS
ncbi:MAG TPA: HAMP domain-containing sensor histidine kinase [Gemmatimonadales bacterium]|jgi:signal transduction histidine kinase|nr:HAMP domain-containing sensor histidine kinase [Gemmatimonadales bacterium]